MSGNGPIRVPPLVPAKAAEYAGLFEKSGAINGVLSGKTRHAYSAAHRLTKL
jgi:epidermal growth factor receptor substrate 15